MPVNTQEPKGSASKNGMLVAGKPPLDSMDPSEGMIANAMEKDLFEGLLGNGVPRSFNISLHKQ